jgi:hypothetical protein
MTNRLTLQSGLKIFAVLDALIVLALGWLIVASDLFS